MVETKFPRGALRAVRAEMHELSPRQDEDFLMIKKKPRAFDPEAPANGYRTGPHFGCDMRHVPVSH